MHCGYCVSWIDAPLWSDNFVVTPCKNANLGPERIVRTKVQISGDPEILPELASIIQCTVSALICINYNYWFEKTAFG